MTKALTKYKLSPAVNLIIDSKKLKSDNLSDKERIRKVRYDLTMISKTLAFRKVDLFSIKDSEFQGSHGRIIKLRIYYPDGENANTPCLIFFHGGGFMSGSIDTHDTLCRKIALESNFTIISVDYNLAPEFKFPCYISDAEDAVRYIFSHTKELLINPDKICIGGDSAGGNLVAVLTHIFRNDPVIKFIYQLLLCPAMEIHKMDSPTFVAYDGHFTVNKEDIIWGNSQVYNSVEEEKTPEASPVYYSDLSGLPPGLTVTAELDIMRYDAEDYAERCKRANTKMETVRFDGMIHDFFIYGRIIPESEKLIKLIAEHLNNAIKKL